MTARTAAVLLAASAAYLTLVWSGAGALGTNYEEAVPYVLTPLDIRDYEPSRGDADAPAFIVASQLPRLAFAPAPDVRWPLLNQPYMTDHLTYGGVGLGALGLDRLAAARLWHALFGLALLWVLFDVARLLGLPTRAALLAVAVTATCLPFTFMYTWARFDESLASWGAVVVLWAALRQARDGRRGWLWLAVLAIGLAVSAKLTALWPLSGLAVAAPLAGWRPPPLRRLALPALAAAPLFAPIVGFAIAGPATANEVSRRLAFLGDLFTTDVIPGTAANLVDYLGNWGGILSGAIRGAAAGAPNFAGWLLIAATLLWLAARTLAAGPVPRRRRLETQMLAYTAVIYVWVVLFFREHRDYQFALLVPLHALAVAAFLDWTAARSLDRRLPGWAAGLLVAAWPLGANLWEQRRLHEDLLRARNAMFHQGVQRASAEWLAAHGVQRPIVVTFYAVGAYELMSGGAVRPVYPFPLLRHAKNGPARQDYADVWRRLLAGGEAPRYAVLPLGENPIEGRHFDEAAIRAALHEVAPGERVATFVNHDGEPLLEIWRVTPPPPGAAPAPAPAARAGALPGRDGAV
ncbi:MAG: hypothetical protein SF182_28510 [Deltaproteobacteria bacterium]|nr:hypothetical protein [Deltaproteobacteria bacterium]